MRYATYYQYPTDKKIAGNRVFNKGEGLEFRDSVTEGYVLELIFRKNTTIKLHLLIPLTLSMNNSHFLQENVIEMKEAEWVALPLSHSLHVCVGDRVAGDNVKKMMSHLI